jgi:UMF1 family MFS transporter
VSWRPTPLSFGSWALYDLANTIFALGVGSLYFTAWLTDNIARFPSPLQGNGNPDMAWALAVDLAMVVVIVLGPWIGALSDYRGPRSRYLVPATLLAVVPTFFLTTASPFASLVLYAVALVGFNLGVVVYDAMLPDVSTPQTIGRVSGIGIAVGYLGSVLAWAIGELLLDAHGYPVVFRVIAVAFLAFALPSFFLVRERPRAPVPGRPPPITRSFARLVAAWRRAGHYPGVTRFLVGRFFYTDAINTLIAGLLTIYAKEDVGFSDSQVRDLLIVSIAGSIAGGLLGGRLVDVIGPRRLLHWTLHTWVAAFVAGIAAGATGWQWLAWPLGVLGGLALGSTWAADRVYMQRISPPRHLGEFYGLYATVGRFATILGPLLSGLLVTVLGLPREAALVGLTVLLWIGRLVLQKVSDEPRAWEEAELVEEA